MAKDNPYFGRSERQLEEISDKYALLEPLLGEYLNEQEKQEQRQKVRQALGISERTLRRYLRKLRLQGPEGLSRKRRSDAGRLRKFSQNILKKALELLKQNPLRSVPMLMKLLRIDPVVGQQAKKISSSTLYYHLKKAGVDFRRPGKQMPEGVYRRFQAKYPNELWQGDARHGIPLPHPNKPGRKRITYLFAWVDDFSRKIMDARYYWDEKLPRMEHSFRQAVLRWGLPVRLYCDNGKVYLARHFLILLIALGVRMIHHRAYAAWCKGKIENVMKTLKRFQQEAALADFKTIEELNSALAAWIEVEYNNKIHSATGETPNDRYQNNLKLHPPKRITDIEQFNALFLWQSEKTVDKFGKIRFQKNLYPLRSLAPGSKVELRYDPFDLSVLQVFYQKSYHGTLKASKLTRGVVSKLPEERKPTTVSPEAIEYFRVIRQEALELKQRQAESFRYSDLNNHKEEH